MRKPASESFPGSLTPAPASAKALRYKNLRYGCKLCPSKVFSQLAAPAKSKTREPAVEGHVRRQHPQEARRWRRIAYRWGVRAYYTDATTADIRKPSELPPVTNDDDTEDEDKEHANGALVATTGYVYADEQLIDPGIQLRSHTDRMDVGGEKYIKTESNDVSVWKFGGETSDALDMNPPTFNEGGIADTEFAPQTTVNATTCIEADQPPNSLSYNSQGHGQDTQNVTEIARSLQLLPAIQLTPNSIHKRHCKLFRFTTYRPPHADLIRTGATPNPSSISCASRRSDIIPAAATRISPL